MFTLDNAKKLTQDMLQRGVIETMEKTSGVMARLPFIEVVGSGYSYNIQAELPTVAYRAVGAGYTPSEVDVKKTTEALTILGGEADVDVFLQATHSNFTDIRALNTESKAKAVARQFEKDFFAGTGASNSFKGLDQRITDSTAGKKIESELTLDALNELLDTVVDGADTLFMSKTLRRQVMNLLQSSNHYIENGQDAFGRMVQYYGGVEIVAVDDSLITKDNIYAVKFGADQYVAGLSNGGIKVKDLGELQDKPVARVRIEFYTGLVTKHDRCFAVLKVKPKKGN